MAVTTVTSNNKLVKYTTEINREWVRGNAFSPYQSESLNAIIRIRTDLEGVNGGEQMNIPLVRRLQGKGKGVGTLVGNEEKIDNYGQRAWIDWKRNAVATTKADQHKDSADIFGEAKPLLADWLNEAKRDELIAAFMGLPTESPPTNLGSDDGDTVNGIRYEDASASQRNTWNADNSDRIVYGAATSNYNATHSTALGNLDTTNDTFTYQNLALLKRVARNANPKIRPYKLGDGREYFVAFAGTNTFRDLANSLTAIDQSARAREGDGMKNNPIYQDGDLMYRGVIIREVPEISAFVTNVWTSLTTAGNSSARVEPVFLCGQQAAYMAIGQMARPTFRKEDDYGMIKGVGIEAAYGVGKMFSKSINNSKLVQWGVATGFYASAAD